MVFGSLFGEANGSDLLAECDGDIELDNGNVIGIHFLVRLWEEMKMN